MKTTEGPNHEVKGVKEMGELFLIPQALIEHLLCARLWVRHLGYSGEQDMVLTLLLLWGLVGRWVNDKQTDTIGCGGPPVPTGCLRHGSCA